MLLWKIIEIFYKPNFKHCFRINKHVFQSIHSFIISNFIKLYVLHSYNIIYHINKICKEETNVKDWTNVFSIFLYTNIGDQKPYFTNFRIVLFSSIFIYKYTLLKILKKISIKSKFTITKYSWYVRCRVIGYFY